jgi:hypothetical protein
VRKLDAIFLALFFNIIGVIAICGTVHNGLISSIGGIIFANLLGSIVVAALVDSTRKKVTTDD